MASTDATQCVRLRVPELRGGGGRREASPAGLHVRRHCSVRKCHRRCRVPGVGSRPPGQRSVRVAPVAGDEQAARRRTEKGPEGAGSDVWLLVWKTLLFPLKWSRGR